jgi:hypothetical protein
MQARLTIQNRAHALAWHWLEVAPEGYPILES